MRVRPRGKYTHASRRNIHGIGQCDYSGMIVDYRDLCKQMQYVGNGLVWTGLYVFKNFLDTPNPQDLVPIVRQDPVPLPHPRPDNNFFPPAVYELTIDMTDKSTYTLSNEETGHSLIQLQGTPSANPFAILFQIVPGQWLVNNQTANVMTVSLIGPLSLANQSYTQQPNTATNYYCDGINFRNTPFFT